MEWNDGFYDEEGKPAEPVPTEIGTALCNRAVASRKVDK